MASDRDRDEPAAVAQGRASRATSPCCGSTGRRSATPSTTTSSPASTPSSARRRRTCAPCCWSAKASTFSAGLDLSDAEGARRRARHRAFAHLAPRLREDPVRQGAGGGGAAWRGGRRRAGAGGGRPCAHRRALGLLRAAGGQPRHFRRRRRLGAAAAADRGRAHDGHDADRAHLFGRGRPDHGADHLSGRRRARATPRGWSLPTASPATRRSPISPSCRRCRASPRATRPPATPWRR